MRIRFVLLVAFLTLVFSDARAGEPQARWWKGNLHTHSLWSDGDDYPEMIADWYQKHSYQFVMLSDHNVFNEGIKWTGANTNRGGLLALEKYLKRFGSWVETHKEGTNTMVRLKSLIEYRSLFEQPGKFLLIEGEEITDTCKKVPVHVNATNLRDLIKPQGGDSVREVIQNNVNAVLVQRQTTGQAMFPHLNHPNFGWAVTAEDIARVHGERFFEVYNGHPKCFNEGDDLRADTDRMWDIVLTLRLGSLWPEPIYGLATDDSHNYHVADPQKSNPGRGWVMVRAPYLTPENIIRAMEAGDFYATTGVRLKNVRREKDRLALEIERELGVTYKTIFIGTRRGCSTKSEPVLDEKSMVIHTTRRYSGEIGAVLAEVQGASPSYTLKGDELYVRAKVISSKRKTNRYSEDEKETAWTQPLIADTNVEP